MAWSASLLIFLLVLNDYKLVIGMGVLLPYLMNKKHFGYEHVLLITIYKEILMLLSFVFIKARYSFVIRRL